MNTSLHENLKFKIGSDRKGKNCTSYFDQQTLIICFLFAWNAAGKKSEILGFNSHK
jgi:hypothetical protein